MTKRGSGEKSALLTTLLQAKSWLDGSYDGPDPRAKAIAEIDKALGIAEGKHKKSFLPTGIPVEAAHQCGWRQMALMLEDKMREQKEDALVKLGPDVPLNFISAQDATGYGHNPFDPIAWAAKGWQRNWGDAAVSSPYFEVLRLEEEQSIRFLILCPSLLRRPLEIYLSTLKNREGEILLNGWGSY